MASITETSISNIALAELGAKRIVSFTDGSKNGSMLGDIFPIAVEYTLELHPWNFAIKRAKNQPEYGTKPQWGWDHAYIVPSDCIRVLAIGKDGVEIDAPFQVESDAATENKIIVTNVDAPIDIKYIRTISNPQVFSPAFVVALVKVIKWFIARPLTGRKEMKDEAREELETFMRKGMSTDGQVGTSEEYTDHELEVVR